MLTNRPPKRGRIIFRRSRFEKALTIMNCRVDRRLTIQSCVLHAELRLEGVIPSENRIPGTIISVENTELKDAHVDWDTVDHVRFRACNWDLRHRPIGEMIHVPADLDIHGKLEVLRQKEEQYRQLRRLYAKEGDARLTNEFLVLETEAQRLQLKQRPLIRRTPLFWFLSVYKYTSLYNGSFLRPLIWLVLLLGVLPIFQMYGGFEVRREETTPTRIDYKLTLMLPDLEYVLHDWVESVLFTLNAMSIKGSNEWIPTSTLSRATSTVAHTLAPGLLLIFAFALRKRFQIPKGLD